MLLTTAARTGTIQCGVTRSTDGVNILSATAALYNKANNAQTSLKQCVRKSTAFMRKLFWRGCYQHRTLYILSVDVILH